VQIDDTPAEPTKGGAYKKELPLGRHTVVVFRPGFETDQRVIPNLAPTGIHLDIRLKPDTATKARMGAELLKRMLAAHGESSADVVARGAWTRVASGLPDERSFALRSGPSETLMLLSSQPGWYLLGCQGSTCQARRDNPKEFAGVRQGSQLKADAAARAERELRFFRGFFISSVLADLRNAVAGGRLRATAESESPGADGLYHLTLEGNDERYVLELNAQGLLAEISHALGAASYSDYVEAGRSKYPKLTRIRAPGEKDPSIHVRLDTIQPFTR
jgi:hypothetical protein